jgi:hypothetical protein
MITTIDQPLREKPMKTTRGHTYGELRQEALKLAAAPDGVTSVLLSLCAGTSVKQAGKKLSRNETRGLLSHLPIEGSKFYLYRVTAAGRALIPDPRSRGRRRGAGREMGDERGSLPVSNRTTP